MARYVKVAFTKLPKETTAALRKTSHFTSTVAYNKLNKDRVPIVTPLKSIRKLAKSKGKQNRVSIVVSKDMKMHKKADGVCLLRGQGKVNIHPITKYYDKRYINDLMEHEVDHIKVYRKKKK